MGGKLSNKHEYPWQVLFLNDAKGDSFCGGAIISDQWLISAAHCFFK